MSDPETRNSSKSDAAGSTLVRAHAVAPLSVGRTNPDSVVDLFGTGIPTLHQSTSPLVR